MIGAHVMQDPGAVPPPYADLGKVGRHRVTFLLLDRFSALSYATAHETLRVANRAAGQCVFSWATLTVDGAPAMSNDGAWHQSDGSLVPLPLRSTLLVCGGDAIERAHSPRLLAWLREQAGRGCHVGGLCTAAWTLARAGLLEGERTTIHWENRDSFAETFPDITLVDKPYVHERNRSSSVGGTSAIDLMLQRFVVLEDETLAQQVAERLLYADIHKLQENSCTNSSHRIHVSNPKVRKAVAYLECNLEDEEMGIEQVADHIAVSIRQLERLFRKYLGQSPRRYLNEMRLDRAMRLLIQTDMSVIEIGVAAGFSSQSSFSRSFVQRFGLPPKRVRANSRKWHTARSTTQE